MDDDDDDLSPRDLMRAADVREDLARVLRYPTSFARTLAAHPRALRIAELLIVALRNADAKGLS